MAENNHKHSISIGGIGTLDLLFALLGYFVYDGLDGLIGILLLSMCFTVLLLVALIPVVGAGIELALMWWVVMPKVLSFTGLGETWLTSLMVGVYLISGGILTFVTSLLVWWHVR